MGIWPPPGGFHGRVRTVLCVDGLTVLIRIKLQFAYETFSQQFYGKENNLIISVSFQHDTNWKKVNLLFKRSKHIVPYLELIYIQQFPNSLYPQNENDTKALYAPDIQDNILRFRWLLKPITSFDKWPSSIFLTGDKYQPENLSLTDLHRRWSISPSWTFSGGGVRYAWPLLTWVLNSATSKLCAWPSDKHLYFRRVLFFLIALYTNGIRPSICCVVLCCVGFGGCHGNLCSYHFLRGIYLHQW